MSITSELSQAKRDCYDKIRKIAAAHNWEFLSNPSGSSHTSFEFQISNAKSKLCGVVKATRAKGDIWVGVDDKLVELMKSSPENLFVIEIDKVWDKLLLIPYNFLRPYTNRTKYEYENGTYYQWTFVIKRIGYGQYFIRKHPAPSLVEYIKTPDLISDVFMAKLENIVALIDFTDDNEFNSRVKERTKNDPTFVEKLIHEMDLQARDPKRIWTKVQKIGRNNRLIELLKIKYGFKCQFCGFSFMKKDGGYYAEGAHLRPLSREGPDTSDNVLILCPNHHKMLDLAQVQIISQSKESIVLLINGQRFGGIML